MSHQQDLYYTKYLKYKEKYLRLQNQMGSGLFTKKKSIVEIILENTYSLQSVKLDSIQDMYIASTSDNSGNLDKLDKLDEKHKWSAQKISIVNNKPQIGKKIYIEGTIYSSAHENINYNYIIMDNFIMPVQREIYLIINNLYKDKEKENIIAFINKISIDDNLSKLINLVYLNMGIDVNKKSFSDRFIKPEYKKNLTGKFIIDFNNLEPPVNATDFFTDVKNPSISEKKIIDLIFNSVQMTINEEIYKKFDVLNIDQNFDRDSVYKNAYEQTYVNKNKDEIIVGIKKIKLLLISLSFFFHQISLDYLIIKN
jgi:hypothetical protein